MPEVRVLRRIIDELTKAAGKLGNGEATSLWAAVAGMQPAEVWLRRDAEPAPDTLQRFWEAVDQRARGVPFAYATGIASFRRLDLAVDSRALIPRPETEGLVELALPGTGGLAADIGTGCGCIALSLAVEGEFEKVIAVEQSPAAAALARENVARIAPVTAVEIREGNLLEPLQDRGERFRLIVSNPPYLSAAELAELDPSVREFEPWDALVSGADGLDATRALFAGAGALLEPGGVLALEIDERRSDAVRNIARECGWQHVAIHNDLFGYPRYAIAQKTPGRCPGVKED